MGSNKARYVLYPFRDVILSHKTPVKTHIARLLTIIGRPQFVIPGMILAAFLCFLPKTEVKAGVIDDNTAVFQWGELSFGGKLEDYQIAIPFPKPVAEREVPKVEGNLDLDKLAKAVAFAETASCTDGTGKRRNNCFGIMRFWLDENGKRHREPKYYKTQADSFKDFKRIWATHYKVVPGVREAHKWTGSDNQDTWLCNVHSKYYDKKITNCRDYIRTL